MPQPLSPETKEALAARLRFYRELGIYDFYRRPAAATAAPVADEFASSELASAELAMAEIPMAEILVAETNDSRKEEMPKASRALAVLPVKVPSTPKDSIAVLQAIREDIGDCTRCKLHKLGRAQIVFGTGNPNADILFVGEGPGADEDRQGEPFVGRAGQLLNNMMNAMGLKREEVYIANVVKCRPPQNRTPENDECDTCSPFLLRQIDAVKPRIIVALGAVAAKNLLVISDSLRNLRGRLHDFKDTKVAVTYHPAYLLRDPSQKKEAWKDLQMVMKYLGMPAVSK